MMTGAKTETTKKYNPRKKLETPAAWRWNAEGSAEPKESSWSAAYAAYKDYKMSFLFD